MSRGLVNLEAYQLMWFSTEISCHHLISIQTEFNLNYEAESFLFPSPESCNKDVASGRKDCVLPLGINKNRKTYQNSKNTNIPAPYTTVL